MLRSIIIASLIILIPLGAVAKEAEQVKPAGSNQQIFVKQREQQNFMERIRQWFKDDAVVKPPADQQAPPVEPAIVVPERLGTMQKLEPGPSVQEMLPLTGSRTLLRNIERTCCDGTGISDIKIKAQQVWNVDGFPFNNKTATGSQRGDFKQIIILEWTQNNVLHQSVLNRVIIDFQFIEDDLSTSDKKVIAVARYAETCPLDSNMALFDTIFTKDPNVNYIQNVTMGAVHPSLICGGITVQLPGGTPTIYHGQANVQSHTWPGTPAVLNSPNPDTLTNAEHLVIYVGERIETQYQIGATYICEDGKIRLNIQEYGTYPAGRKFFEFIDPSPHIYAFRYEGTNYPSRLYDEVTLPPWRITMCADQ